MVDIAVLNHSCRVCEGFLRDLPSLIGKVHWNELILPRGGTTFQRRGTRYRTDKSHLELGMADTGGAQGSACHGAHSRAYDRLSVIKGVERLCSHSLRGEDRYYRW